MRPCLPLTEVAAADATIARRCPGPRSPTAASECVGARARSAAAWTSCGRSGRERPGSGAPSAPRRGRPPPPPLGAPEPGGAAPAPGAPAPGPALVVAAGPRARGVDRPDRHPPAARHRRLGGLRLAGDRRRGRRGQRQDHRQRKGGARPGARGDARHPHEHAHHRGRQAQGPHAQPRRHPAPHAHRPRRGADQVPVDPARLPGGAARAGHPEDQRLVLLRRPGGGHPGGPGPHRRARPPHRRDQVQRLPEDGRRGGRRDGQQPDRPGRVPLRERPHGQLPGGPHRPERRPRARVRPRPPGRLRRRLRAGPCASRRWSRP